MLAICHESSEASTVETLKRLRSRRSRLRVTWRRSLREWLMGSRKRTVAWQMTALLAAIKQTFSDSSQLGSSGQAPAHRTGILGLGRRL